jgi:CxxC motif-containing protein (DUF1111 family)
VAHGAAVGDRIGGARPGRHRVLPHDGRARTLRDAIRFHGGEGARSRAAFDRLPAEQQERLLAYLRSL